MPRKPKRITEKTTQKEIIDYLKSIGAVVVKINNGGTFNPVTKHFIPPREKGVADILCCYKSYFIAIEVKGPKTKPSEFQKVFLQNVLDAGGMAIWTRDLFTVKDLIAVIDEDKTSPHRDSRYSSIRF